MKAQEQHAVGNMNPVMVTISVYAFPLTFITGAYCMYRTTNPLYLLCAILVGYISCILLQRFFTTYVRTLERQTQILLEILRACYVTCLITHWQVVAGPESPAYLLYPFTLFIGTYSFSVLINNTLFLASTVIIKVTIAIFTMHYIGNDLQEVLFAAVTLSIFGAMSLLCCSFTNNIIRLEKQQTESNNLQRTLELYQRLYKYAPVMFLSLDAKTYTIIDLNEHVTSVMNSPSEQLIDTSFFDLFAKEFRENVRSFLLSRGDGGVHYSENDYFKLKSDNNDLYVSMFLSEMRDTPTGQCILHVILSDVSPVIHAKRAVEDLNVKLVDAKERAEQSNSAKSQFLAMMSHELRTPLHAAICSCDLLLGTPLSEEQQNYADVMSTSSNLLLRLITKILDFSKIEAGALILESKPFNLIETAHSIIVALRYRAQEKNVALSLDISRNVPRRAIGDSTRLSQVLINLVGNAIKFTEAKGQVHVSVETIGTDPHSLEIRVIDNGIGIPASSLCLLFKQFSQVDNSHSRRFDGTGLGLCISKSIAEEMGGTITVESIEGVGSTFIFTCKLEPETQPEPIPEIKVVDHSFVPGHWKILVAEDNSINRNVMLRMLTRLGFTDITMAVDGEEAFNAFKSKPFDVILMDNCMPRCDGIASCRLIREYETAHHLKPVSIISVTASATTSQRMECVEAGMSEFLTKPVVMVTLREMLQQVLEKNTT
jgi:signal transduction histidine kinase/ActR/RegA family two-component response regulator